MSALTAREGYRLWAERYETETAVSHLENLVVQSLAVSTEGRRLLDVGCGTGRRMRSALASHAVGIDLTFEMLSENTDAGSVNLAFAVADAAALPIAARRFDVVWCRLMIGHVRDLTGTYRELARVCRANGFVVVSDLAPEAAAAGHRRTFRDSDGIAHELEHFVHSAHDHACAAADAGLSLASTRDGRVGPSIKEFYVTAGRGAAYERQIDLPLVRAFAWRRTGRSAVGSVDADRR